MARQRFIRRRLQPELKLPGQLTSRWQNHYTAALLIFCGLVAFIPSLPGYFLADDFSLLSWTHVHSFNSILEFFDPNTWWFYRPLVKLIYWLGQTVFGLHASPLHVISLLLHWANAFLLYRLLIGLGSQWVVGITASLFFLLNGHHAETVSWIAAIGDLIAATCILGALICFQRFCSTNSRWYWFASLGLFIIGLLTRETTILLPGLLLLMALVFRLVLTWTVRKRLLVMGSYMLPLLGYIFLQLAGRANSGSNVARGGLQFHTLNLDSILLGILDYVHGLLPGGTLLAQLPLETLRVTVWIEWAIILVIAVLLVRSGQRIMLFGLGWLIATPLLFIFFSTPTDRYFYLPSIGYAILLSAFLVQVSLFIAERQPKWSFAARLTTATIGAGLLLAQTVNLLNNNGLWAAAARTSGGIIHDVHQAVPEAHDYSTFYFVGVPANQNGIPLFGDGLLQAIQLSYEDNRTLNSITVTCDQLRTIELPRYNFQFTYKGDGVTQLASKEDCR